MARGQERSESAAGGRGGRPPSRRPALPQPFRWIRNAGLLVAWVGALICGWQAGASVGRSGPSGAPGDLLGAVLHGAAAWLGVTVIWLAGIHLCQRIIQRPEVGGQRSAVNGQLSAVSKDLAES